MQTTVSTEIDTMIEEIDASIRSAAPSGEDNEDFQYCGWRIWEAKLQLLLARVETKIQSFPDELKTRGLTNGEVVPTA